MNLMDLERNDIAGAVQVFKAAVLDGTWDRDLAESLMMLQDDEAKQAELSYAIGQLSEDDDAFRTKLWELMAKSDNEP